MEVKCPVCKAGLSGSTEDDLVHAAKEHIENDHPEEDAQKLMSAILGMIRN